MKPSELLPNHLYHIWLSNQERVVRLESKTPSWDSSISYVFSQLASKSSDSFDSFTYCYEPEVYIDDPLQHFGTGTVFLKIISEILPENLLLYHYLPCKYPTWDLYFNLPT
jgi:hypothetical protein